VVNARADSESEYITESRASHSVCVSMASLLDPSVSVMRQLIETHRSDKSALERLYTVSFS
jgi:hypothetical protein